MSKADSPGVFLVIGVLLMLSLVVDAQPTVGEDGSCEFDAFDETATARDLKLIREDLAEVKNLLGSRQQSCSALNSSSLCEYKTYSLLLSCECSGVARISDYKPIDNASGSIKCFAPFVLSY